MYRFFYVLIQIAMVSPQPEGLESEPIVIAEEVGEEEPVVLIGVPQFPISPAVSFHDPTIDLRLCDDGEFILFGVGTFEKDWAAWQDADKAGNVVLLGENWGTAKQNWASKAREKVTRVQCRKKIETSYQVRPVIGGTEEKPIYGPVENRVRVRYENYKTWVRKDALTPNIIERAEPERIGGIAGVSF